jgi:hypothetical protein
LLIAQLVRPVLPLIQREGMILFEARPHEAPPVGPNETMRVGAHPALKLVLERGVFEMSHFELNLFNFDL